MGMIEDIARYGGTISEEQLAEYEAYKKRREAHLSETLGKYNTLKKQAERITYLERRIQEMREEIQRLRNGV